MAQTTTQKSQRRILRDNEFVDTILNSLKSDNMDRINAATTLLHDYYKFETITEFLEALIKKHGLTTRIITVIRHYYTSADEEAQ